MLYGMAAERYEIRLDSERRRQLRELAALYEASASDVVRRLIDQAYEELDRERRLEAVRKMASLEIEDVPDPEELSRQLDATHDIPDLY